MDSIQRRPSNTVFLERTPETSGFSGNEMSALSHIEEEVGKGVGLEEVLDVVWEETESLLPRDRMGLAFLEDNCQRLVAYACHADYEDVCLGPGYAAGLGDSSLQSMLKTGEIRFVRSLKDYLETHPESESTELLIREGVASNITLPLLVDDRPVGFLFFSSRREGAFTERHGRLLRAVLSHIAQAIEKAWIIKQLQNAKDNYFSTLGFVAHEMKSPLGSILGQIEIYLKGYLGQVDPVAATTFERIQRSAEYLRDVVQNYLNLTRLEKGEMDCEIKPDVRLKENLIDFALDVVHPHAEVKNCTFQLELPSEEILIPADKDLMRIVMVNLIDNAIKYGYEDGTVQIRAGVVAGKLGLSVRNEGVGFTEEEGQRLFRRFSRLKQKGTEKERGTGLGLYLSWWIIQQHGGRIRADSEPRKWAEFTVVLPHAKILDASGPAKTHSH